MDVERRRDVDVLGVLGLVLQVGEVLSLDLVVVIKDGEGPDDLLVGLPPLDDQGVPDQVPEGLGPGLVPDPVHLPVECLQELWFQRYADACYLFGHGW